MSYYFSKSKFVSSCIRCDKYAWLDRYRPEEKTPFDIYNLKFKDKCSLYEAGISFFDIPKHRPNFSLAAIKQVEYYNRPNDAYVDKAMVKEFLDELIYPIYSLDFETYQAVIPECEGIATYEQVPFQYSLHIVESPDSKLNSVKEEHFLDLNDADTRRAITESLVKNIPYSACVIATTKAPREILSPALQAFAPTYPTTF